MERSLTATIEQEIRLMGARTGAALAHYGDKVKKLVDAYLAVVAERDAFERALKDADAHEAAAVRSALDADDEVDSAAIAAAEDLIPELNEGPPADSGSGDSGSGDSGSGDSGSGSADPVDDGTAPTPDMPAEGSGLEGLR